MNKIKNISVTMAPAIISLAAGFTMCLCGLAVMLFVKKEFIG